jgi:hypothetical protein
VHPKIVQERLGHAHIVTDLTTPGLPRNGGGYIIPNGSGGWMATNPPFHKVFIYKADDNKGGRLKNMIRLMTYWNNRNDHLLQSFHMELLIEETYRIGDIADSRAFAMEEGFRCMVQYVRRGMPDPWIAGGTMSSYLPT